ncbi:MAG: hypothetical protein ACNS62_09555 [Candidatus Cyclobacteriaceae bacterium M3_2C_046]
MKTLLLNIGLFTGILFITCCSPEKNEPSSQIRGLYTCDVGYYAMMHFKEDEVTLTTSVMPVTQTFQYEQMPDKIKIIKEDKTMILNIINGNQLDGGDYGIFLKNNSF